ncbi:PRC and DUF2382 domain-containing protein [Nocardiopsis exhalans]|uniref:PRC and DUF2382 domain-containing protein n=1 Tax=Nocardiopsis exhalans TaxID=163604 RepID=A0ABY5DDZ0_9ACTN|nr:PRC and DUF2382 domain-containing protein [Nocardiopsis exhalans]USY22561.1 PRC and DUF2382 domain-containing protein [Nocardiopsis exhalans]
MAAEFVPEDLVGHRVLDTEGHNVGKIKQVFLDDQTGRPSWVSVHTGLFGMKETLVPLQGAQPVEEDIQIPYDKATVKDAPHVDADRHVSPEDEELVRDYFARQGGFPRQAQGEQRLPGGAGEAANDQQGVPLGQEMPKWMGGPGIAGGGRERAEGPVPEGRGDEPEMHGNDPADAMTESGQAHAMPPAAHGETADRHASERLGGPGGADTEDMSVLRHEEQVDIGVERREGGQARMRRHVETERFDETVPLHHEELEVERRPITDPSQVTDTGHMEEDEETFTLYEERPVVSKEEVPVEEIHVRKRDVTREEHVEGELRKEHIEFDGEDGEPPRS